jgi:glycosyltransferase involved in cell wall biosynthesis
VPSVDIFIPNYNYARFLVQCLDSVRLEAPPSARIVVIDNASTDDSVAIARQAALEDPRIEVVVHAHNLGSQASYNQAIELARAEFFMILCADDVVKPGALAAALAVLEADPSVVFALGSTSEGWVEGTDPKPFAPQAGPVLHEGDAFIRKASETLAHDLPAHEMVVRTSVQKLVGGYRPWLHHMDDLEMLLRLSAQGRVAVLDGSLIAKRIHSGNQLKPLWGDRLGDLEERRAAFASFFDTESGRDPRLEGIGASTQAGIAEAAYWSGVSHLLRGHGTGGMRLFRFALGLEPALAWRPPLGYLLRTEWAVRRLGEIVRAGVSGIVGSRSGIPDGSGTAGR